MSHLEGCILPPPPPQLPSQAQWCLKSWNQKPAPPSTAPTSQDIVTEVRLFNSASCLHSLVLSPILSRPLFPPLHKPLQHRPSQNGVRDYFKPHPVMQDELPNKILHILPSVLSTLYQTRLHIPHSRNSDVEDNFGGHYSAFHADLKTRLPSRDEVPSMPGLSTQHDYLGCCLWGLGLATVGGEGTLICAASLELEKWQ